MKKKRVFEGNNTGATNSNTFIGTINLPVDSYYSDRTNTETFYSDGTNTGISTTGIPYPQKNTATTYFEQEDEHKEIKELLLDFAKWAKKNGRKIEFSDFDEFVDNVNGETRGF